MIVNALLLENSTLFDIIPALSPTEIFQLWPKLLARCIFW
jgi:hypothetical protein